MMVPDEQKNKIHCAYDFLSSVSTAAYNDLFLLSNQVLSKNPFTNTFLASYLNTEEGPRKGLSCIIKKLLRYYFFSFKNFTKYCFEFIEFRFSHLRFAFSKQEKELIIIDMPFLISSIEKNGTFTDTYFPGLADYLSKKKMHFAYLPLFSGIKKHCAMSRVLRTLKKQGIACLTEYQLLTTDDLLYMLYFIAAYPFHVCAFIKKINGDNHAHRCLKDAMFNSLGDITFMSFSRYLLGRRLARLAYEKIKVISWDENQVDNKNFYKGLRDGSDKVTIYGAQLLIYSKNVLNISTDEAEAPFGVVPDVIVVNGPWYIPDKTSLRYVTGPSLRFKNIFTNDAVKENKENILVLLPYYDNETATILQMLKDLEPWKTPLLIKPHPVVDSKRFQRLIPENAKIVHDNIYDLFKISKMMISGGASGTLLEAAALGVPAIFIKNPDSLDGNPLPEYGKGIIWDSVSTSGELKEKLKFFDEMLKKNRQQVISIAAEYKKNFFCEPTEERITEAFDLKAFD